MPYKLTIIGLFLIMAALSIIHRSGFILVIYLGNFLAE